MVAPSLLIVAALWQGAAAKADTLPPLGVVEEALMVRHGTIELAGTLAVPRTPAVRIPVALIIAGSGPTDRNGNSPMGLRSNVYAQLAWRLAERGIASLRYDKRGLGGSRGSTFDMRQVTIDDFAGDARAAAESLARDRRFDRIVLIGHSEGASLGLLAARAGAPVAGVVSIAGLGRSFGAVLRGQLARQLDSATLLRYDSAMAGYLRGEPPPDVPPQLGVLFLPVNQAFVRSLAAFDPPAAIRGVRQPVLIVQGGRDVQVGVVDAERLHAARPDARLVVIAEANHVLKRAADTTMAGQGATYLDPTVPIMPEVVTAIAEWIVGLAVRR